MGNKRNTNINVWRRNKRRSDGFTHIGSYLRPVYDSSAYFFTVLNITCAKFRRATVKENYKGIKVLGYISETLIFLNVYAVILFSFSMIPEFINQWSEGELNIIILISAMLPLLY